MFWTKFVELCEEKKKLYGLETKPKQNKVDLKPKLKALNNKKDNSNSLDEGM